MFYPPVFDRDDLVPVEARMKHTASAPVDAAERCSLFLLTCALLLMTSSRSKA